MTIAPRRLVNFLAGLRTHRLRARLHAQGNGTEQQRAAFRVLLTRFEKTEFGRQHGLHARSSYDEFRARVPLRTSAEFRAFTERMAGGATNVLWPGRCTHFVYTAGTVDGTPKMLPVTADMFRHLRAAITDAWLMHAARVGRISVFEGRHVHTGPSTALMAAHGARAGYVDGIVRASLSEWSRHNLSAPSAALAELPEGAEKTAALVQALGARDVRLAAGTPGALIALLQEAARAGAHWPNLECCVHTGTILGIQEKALVEAAGARVSLHELYAGAEGVFAAQDGDARGGLRLFTDAGIFFEFLPVRELSAEGGGASRPQCLPLAEVKTDVEYALVVTTPAGVARCIVGDTVRFVSTTPPRLIVTGRTEFLLNSFGEQVTERELSDALIDVCVRNQWEAVHFHVAPYFTRKVPRVQGCHEWWVELRPGTMRTPTGPLLAAELDAELGRRNRDYTARRANGALEAPVVRLVMPGVFTQWSELHPTFGGPGKLARCRNDRLMADQLAGIARFHTGTIAPFAP
ncbi:MAG: hypothetical protein C0518_03190 [Opitutus sp.]|nr:hypothetical protein [Opitutus sp.]